jgi:hypothetical protein
MGHPDRVVWGLGVTGRSRALVAALAVFALAVGVLIGSGPLRAGFGGSSIAAELAQAESDAKAAAEEASQGRDFADAVGPKAIYAQLQGHTVALVRTADATDDDVTAATARLADAGAEIGAHVALTEEWTAEDRGPFRDALAEQITAALANPPTGASSSQVLSMALAQSLAPTIAAGDDLVGAAAAERADTLWTLLTEANLVTGSRTGDSDLFVLVAPGGDVGDLAGAFVATSYGTVVAFTGAKAGPAATATTVTNASTFYGAWAVVGATINTLGGIAGDYDASDADELIAGPS